MPPGQFNGPDTPILTDDHAILANLSVPILFREGEAQIPGTILIGGFVLPGGGGTDHVVASHGVEWVDLFSIGGTEAILVPIVPVSRLSHSLECRHDPLDPSS